MLVSVEQLAAEVRRGLANLPLGALQQASEELREAAATLQHYGSGSLAPEIASAVAGLAQARHEIDRTQGLCQHVVTLFERYLNDLGVAPALTPATAKPSAALPASSPGRPRAARSWRTVAEEHGGAVSYPSYGAAKRALGSRAEQELHHIVEQCQAQAVRSGFTVERINTTDNFVWLPIRVHRRITAFYARKPPGMTTTRRDAMNGLPWEDQYRRGERAVTRALREDENRE